MVRGLRPVVVLVTLIFLGAGFAQPTEKEPQAPDAHSLRNADLLKMKELIVRDTVSEIERIRRHDSAWSSPPVLISVGTSLVAILSLLFGFYQFLKNRSDSLAWKAKDAHASRRAKLLDSLVWFDGSVHKRSVGISVIEGHWNDHPELRITWSSLLAAQIVMIISQPAAVLAQSELDDSRRILVLLRRAKVEVGSPSFEVDRCRSIMLAFNRLSTRVVITDSGTRLQPTERKVFISQIKGLFADFPDLLLDSTMAKDSTAD